MTEHETPSDPAGRWEKAQAVFHAATELSADARVAYVRQACGDDATLCEQVLAMLTADDEGHALLDGGLAAAAQHVLSPASAGAVGQAFGPYRVTGVLGEGGMGVVVRARRADLNSEAAIKILRDSALSPARRERFAFEQRALAQLDHPGIARLFDADVLADGTPWFAMELVDGVPLNEYAREHALAVGERLRLFRDVCEAVQHAHSRAILHRDLKPSNMLVRPDGTVKLLDFGISKPIESLDDPELATRTGMRMMTPAYASPEQVRGEGLGVHSDVYSLGVILYELLAGRLPFDLAGRTPSEAATLLTQQAARRPSTVAAESGAFGMASRDAWNDLDVLCLTAMHRDVARRYRTVDALLRDVDRFLAGEPLEARGDSFRYRAGKFVRRHAAAVVAGGSVLVLLVMLVAFYTVRLRTERDRAEAQSLRARRIQSFMTDLFQGADDQVGPSDTLRVMTLLMRGIESSGEWSSEPDVQAELQRTLGNIMLSRMQLEQADTLLSAALRYVRASPRANDEDVVLMLRDYAQLRNAQERWDDAERYARAARDRARKELPAGHRLIAETAGMLGRVLSDRGDVAASVPLLEESARWYAAQREPSAEGAVAISDLAITYYYLGRVAESDSLNHVALSMSRAMYGPRHPHVATDLINLGNVQSQLGRYAQADTLLREALDIMRAFYGGASPQAADAAVMRARNLAYMDNRAEVDTLLAGALVILERTYGPDHVAVAGALNDMGRQAAWKDRFVEAERYYRRALAIYRKKYGPHHDKVGVATANLGDLFMHMRDPRRAEGMLREALAAFDGANEPTGFNAGVARVKLGRVLLMQKRFPEAEKESHAGYDILKPQVEATSSFLRGARIDLVKEYEAMHRPADAARFRAELADTSGQ